MFTARRWLAQNHLRLSSRLGPTHNAASLLVASQTRGFIDQIEACGERGLSEVKCLQRIAPATQAYNPIYPINRNIEGQVLVYDALVNSLKMYQGFLY